MKTIAFLGTGTARFSRRSCFSPLAVLVALALSPIHTPAETHFRQTNLVSDQPGVASLQDTNLVNAWGLASSGNSPFWVSDNGTGVATLYTVTNDAADVVHVSKVALTVFIPGEGNVSGQVFNNTTGFNTNAFLFVSEDGTISGWRGALGVNAEVLVARASAVYKGATLANTANGPLLLAANFAEGTVDAYDGTMELVAQFTDPAAPADYAPFNVQAVDGLIFVTFAKKEAGGVDDVSGTGHGIIDVLNPETGRFHRFVTGSDAGGKFREIDSPWGVALAPGSFGEHAGELLVGNFGSGTIMTFDANGKFHGFLKGEHKGPIVIDGLWALRVGNGGRGGDPDAVYFTAGPDEENHGLFGSLYPAKEKEDKGDNDDQGGNNQGGNSQGGKGGR